MVQRACKKCKAVFDGSVCTQCGSDDVVDTFKGKIVILNPEQSEIAQQMKITKKGTFAVKLG